MKGKNSRLLLAAFALIGIAAFGSGQQASSTPGYQQDSDQPGVMGQDQSAAPTSGASGQMSGTGQTNPGVNNWNLDTSTPMEILVNQTPVQFSDAQPGIIDGRLMVPLRAFAEQTGSTVRWNNDSKEVEINLPSQETLTLTSIVADTAPNYGTPVPTGEDSDAVRESVGGPYEPVEPLPDTLNSSQVVIIDNHAYMPLDQLATAFDGLGSWDQSGDTATITMPSDMITRPGFDDTPSNFGSNDYSGPDNAIGTDDRPDSDSTEP